MQNFSSFQLPSKLLEALTRIQFLQPTPIQAQVIPLALNGQDVIGIAQTGTGKTGAFGIPLITHLLKNEQARAMVVVPTRELALQVMIMLRSMLGKPDRRLQTAVLIGGDPIVKQFRQLKASPRLIVGTPGRINDHLERRSLRCDAVDFLVLDEADRMLDMGFSPQIDAILKHVPKQRQTLLFSATMPKQIGLMCKNYMNDPVQVSLAEVAKPAENIKQEVVFVSEQEKYRQLMEQLSQRDGSIIIFVKTKILADKMAKQLQQAEYGADALHGDLRHHKRAKVIRAFRDQQYRILVATDIAARGLDIDHVRHVINYDLPQCPEDYIHRIGRTARAGAHGEALCFIAPHDRAKWRAIARMMNPNAPEHDEPSFKSKAGSKSRFKPKFKPKFKAQDKSSSFKKSWGKSSTSSENSQSVSRTDRTDRADRTDHKQSQNQSQRQHSGQRQHSRQHDHQGGSFAKRRTHRAHA